MSKAQATNKANKKNGSADTSSSADIGAFDDAVREGKAIIENAERGQWRLGELAHSVEKQYGESKLAKFAEAIGVAPCTLARYRDVYRAWKDIYAPGRESMPPYAVLRELAQFATHPKCQQLNPKITKREAYELRRKLKGDEEEKQEQDQDDEWLKDDRKWFKQLVVIANEASRVAGVIDAYSPEQLKKLRQAIDPGLLMYVRGGGRMLIRAVEHLEALLAEQEEAEPVEASPPMEQPQHQEATAHVAA
jgi:hypothetical protein